MRPNDSDHAATIRAGRAYVRLIEACAVLIELEEHDEARVDLERLRRRAAVGG